MIVTAKEVKNDKRKIYRASHVRTGRRIISYRKTILTQDGERFIFNSENDHGYTVLSVKPSDLIEIQYAEYETAQKHFAPTETEEQAFLRFAPPQPTNLAGRYE